MLFFRPTKIKNPTKKKIYARGGSMLLLKLMIMTAQSKVYYTTLFNILYIYFVLKNIYVFTSGSIL